MILHYNAIMNIKELANNVIVDGLMAYLIKALALIACLWIVSRLAPMLPAPILPVVFVAYAVLATLGALYFTTIKRVHREYQLNKEGKLSQINRKWTLKLAAFFLISLVSAFLFVLESPRWDTLEWVLTFLAVPLYFIAYKAIEHGLRKEFDKKFLKARAMKASFWLMGIVLCLVYAILATALTTTDVDGLREAFDQSPRLFADSPSAFMSEADLISSFMQGVTSYLMSQVAAQYFLVGFVYHFVVYAFVFYGMINQFGFCLLNSQEIKGEFQLLPANYESQEGQRILKRYIAILLGIALVGSGVFLFLDFKTAEARATGEPTKIETFIDDLARDLLYRVDDEYDKSKRFKELENQFEVKYEEAISQRNAEMEPLINGYYDRCKLNVDAYLDWYEGFEGQSMRVFKWIPGEFIVDRVKEKFIEEMNSGNDEAHIQEIFAGFQTRLEDQRFKYSEDANAIDPDDERAIVASQKANEESLNKLILWSPLTSENASTSVKDILLNGSDLSREQLKESIIELIDQARSDALSSLSIGGSTSDDASSPAE